MADPLRLTGWVILSSLTLGGCMVGPDYQPPAAPLAPAWNETGDQSVVTDEIESWAWWQTFQDPVLDRLIELAYQQNLTLQTAGVRVLQARAELGIAAGQFYPQQQQLIGDATFNRQSAKSPDRALGPARPDSELSFWTGQLGAQAAWELDLWGRFRRSVEAADSALLASVADYDDVLVSLTADVATLYIELRTLQQRLRIVRENAVIQEQALQIAQSRFSGGVTSERDVQQARQVLASTLANIPQLEAAIVQTKNAIATLLGLPPNPLTELLGTSEAIPTPPPQVAVGIPADLLRRRPDIRRAELNAAQQSALIGVATADLYPAFTLVGTLGVASTSLGRFQMADIFSWQSRFAAAGPSVTWNILNYGQITNQVRAQDAIFQAALIDYQNTVLRAQQEVEDGIAAFIGASRRTQDLVVAVAAAQRSRELATLQYREGIADFTTVLVAEQDILLLQEQLMISMGDIPASLVRTYRALGGGWQLRGGNEFVAPEIIDMMRQRTDWGRLLGPSGIPARVDTPGPTIRAPDW